MPPCAPPGSLPVWATALLVGAVALVGAALWLAALALAAIWLKRWTSQPSGALRLLGALLAVALAMWSLSLRARLLSVSDTLTTSYRDDAEYCVAVTGHGGPGYYLAQYHAWLLQATALVDSLQREALITVGVTIAFLLVASAVTLRAWRRDVSQWPHLVTQPGIAADDDSPQITALDPGAQRTWPVWSRQRRALAALVTLALIAASLGALAVFKSRQAGHATAQARMCSPTITASSLHELLAIGLELYPTSDVVPVDARAALSASKQQVSPAVVASASCVIERLLRVQSSRLPELTLDQDIWVVAYHMSGSGSPEAASATTPSDHWLFIDAHEGAYVGGAILLSSAGR